MEQVYWNLSHRAFKGTETTLSHLTNDRVNTLCGKKIDLLEQPVFKEVKNIECKRCLNKLK